MSLAMKARQKVKRKGAAKDRVFGCDLVEHLQLSGQEVPQVLKSCTEFVERHGIVDGIYRLSGVSSNIQKLRLEFDTDRTPDLNKDVYLQDIHCVSSLCKAYFRELPNPLLTYQLYDKFADAVAIQMEEGRLEKIKEVLKELPAPHYRTLEFLMKHLVHMGSFSSQTNMHVRNLAIVWAPNLLRSKDIEASGFNGTAAFMEVRIQSIVVEFILTHVEQIFGDAPLRAGTHESLRKSLLLMGSPVPLPDEKCCFSYNVPAILNQGDGPPQMRPYHTIIELTDSKRKGSLKGKKWRSIFNLGRYSQDAKRKFLRLEDKDDKTGKLRLRPAKSMDSLSSVPCAGDDEALLGRKKSQKKLLTLGRESFDGPASLDSSFVMESEDYPGKIKMEETQAKSEDEATAKSEPTTPKATRSSLVGGPSPQGRSPKSGRSRAEKCAGVHISGPFSVTVPFHITSNLTLSRLTRGLECPALSHCPAEKEALEEMSTPKEEEGSSKEGETEANLVFTATADQGKPAEPNAGEDSLDLEENRMSLEVQDSFSFLDNQDAWLGNSLEEECPQKSPGGVPAVPKYGLDTCPFMEDDMGTGFMNEIIGGGMQLDTFSSLPPLNYLSIEECMNEHSEDEDDQYYLAMGCTDGEEAAKEVDSEEVYLSAFDDLSPLANEAEPLQPSDKIQDPDTFSPKSTQEDQPTAVAGGTTPKDSADPHLFEAGTKARSGAPPPHDSGLADSYLHPKSIDSADEESVVLPICLPELANPSANELGISPNPSSHCSTLEARLKDEAETPKEEPGLLLEAEGAAGGNGDNLQMKPNHPDEAPGENLPRPLDLKYENQGSPSSLEDEWNWQLEPPNLLEVDHGHRSPCVPSMEMDGPLPEAIAISDNCMDCELPLQETKLLQGGETAIHPQMAKGHSVLADLTWFDGHPSSLLGSSSEKESSERSLGLRATSIKQPASEVSLLGVSTEPDISALEVCSPKTFLEMESLLPTPEHAPPVETPKASKQEPSDGSVHMKLTSSLVRVQQVKSFPVIPPKPQFAKVPPSLTPRIPAKEVPNPPIPYPSNDGNGMKERSKESSSLPRSLRPTSLDTSYSSNAESDKNMEALLELSKTPTSLETKCSGPGVLQTQRNSMPVSFEKDGGGSESKDRNISPLPPFLPPLEKHNLCPKSNDPGRDDLHLMKCSLPESLERYGKSEFSPRQCNQGGLGSPEKHGSFGSASPTQRWNNWRNGGSMSFDEAVALAKERHGSQAPMRRMKTYCYGEAEGLHSLAPHCRPALKPLGQRPLRPQSCVSPAATAPEGHIWGKPLLSPTALESPLSPNQEKAPFCPQDFPPRSRLMGLSKMGRRLSLSEEATSYMEPQERR